MSSIPTHLIVGAEWLPFLAELTAKVTLVLLLAAAASALLWRSSAAVRHMVWCVGIAGVLALPLSSALVPAWELPVLPAPVAMALVAPRVGVAGLAVEPPDIAAALPIRPVAQPRPTLAAEPRSADADARLPGLAIAIAAAGVLVGLLWLAVGYWGVTRLGRRAEVVRNPEWLRTAQDAAEQLGLRRPVLLLRSRGAVMPATWGLLWPSVVLPSAADHWSDERRRVVLAHELAHVKRFDCLTQALAQVACVLFWWHPAVWYAARRLRVERERACDDLVLGAGARASDYATHLLEIARAYRGPRLAAPAMVSMAKPSQLESRLLSVLDVACPRSAPSVRATILSVLVGVVVVGPLAAMRPTGRAAGHEPAGARSAAALSTAESPAEPSSGPEAARETRPEGRQDAPQPEMAPVPGPLTSRLAGPRARQPSRSPARADTIPRKEWTDERIDELIALRSVGVDTAYISALRSAGYRDLTSRQLIAMRATGVSVRYAAEMNAAGFGHLTPEQLISLRALGVNSEYLGALRRHGYTALTVEEAKSMRAVGVDGDYIEELNRAGYRGIAAEQLVSLRALGVTGDYITQLKAAGLDRLDASTLTSLRALGVTPAYIRELAGVGLSGLSSRQLTELRAHNITADYVRELGAAGFATLTPDQLIRLRVSGLDRELTESRRRTRAPERR